MGLFHHAPETYGFNGEPLDPEANEKIVLYQQLSLLIEEAKTLPGFPGEELGAALGEYETRGKLMHFSESVTNLTDLRAFVDQFRTTVEQYRPLSTVH